MIEMQSYEPDEKLLIFSTNIKSRKQINEIRSVFKMQAFIEDWWVDIEDIDNVMRVNVSDKLYEAEIIKLLHKSGFTCEVLQD